MPTEPGPLRVCELFHSLQGESTLAGLPCVFVRLGGCNLNCSYCDTRYACETAGETMTIAEVMRLTRRYPGAMVEITGGEPLLQPAAVPLLADLVAAGRTVLLETNGSIDIAKVPPGVRVIMDIKCPDSGEKDSFLAANLDHVGPETEIKFVLSSERDYQWARKRVQAEIGRLLPPERILFSAVPGRLELPRLAAWILADNLAVRLQPQLHKILWPERDRGV